MENYKTPNEVLINQIGKDPEITKAIAMAHKVCDYRGHFQHYCALLYPDRYKVDKVLKNYAMGMYQHMKAAIEIEDNTLYFVAMGCDYEARYTDDVCNHRIRTEIVNPSGRNFFIEVGTWGEGSMSIDHVIDRDMEEEYNKEAAKYRSLINERGGFWKHGEGSLLYEQYQKYQEQPYHWYKKEIWHDLKIKYTNENILKLVNTLFECNFNEIVIDRYFLTQDDYKSKSV